MVMLSDILTIAFNNLFFTSGILETIDSGKITILTALDMFAAFDTLDHPTFFRRLQHTFGWSGFSSLGIRSYLTNRSSFVKIDSSTSPCTTICTGVLQSSLLDPLLFVLFISPAANVINTDLSNINNLLSFTNMLMTPSCTSAQTLLHLYTGCFDT